MDGHAVRLIYGRLSAERISNGRNGNGHGDFVAAIRKMSLKKRRFYWLLRPKRHLINVRRANASIRRPGKVKLFECVAVHFGRLRRIAVLRQTERQPRGPAKAKESGAQVTGSSTPSPCPTQSIKTTHCLFAGYLQALRSIFASIYRSPTSSAARSPLSPSGKRSRAIDLHVAAAKLICIFRPFESDPRFPRASRGVLTARSTF